MSTMADEAHRDEIVKTFACWAAQRAIRGKPKEVVKQVLSKVDFDAILSGTKNIEEAEFDEWHRDNCRRANSVLKKIGWTAKILNIYLKMIVYVGNEGRPGLKSCIHPPLDNKLISALKRKCRGNRDIWNHFHPWTSMRAIKTYQGYYGFITGCKKLAAKEGRILFEVEQFWPY